MRRFILQWMTVCIPNPAASNEFDQLKSKEVTNILLRLQNTIEQGAELLSKRFTNKSLNVCEFKVPFDFA